MEKTMPEAENVEATEDQVEVQLDPEQSSSEDVTVQTEPVQGELPLESPKEKELEEYSETVQKRISKLTAKMREAERREQAALDYAKGVQTQLAQQQTRTNNLDQSLITEFENRVTAQTEMHKQQLREAIDRGDVDAQVAAQKSLAEVAADNERLKVAKSQQEQLAKAPPQPQPQMPAGQPQAQPQTQTRAPDAKAVAWAEKNEWFGADEPMTLTAFSIHKNLVESEGFDPHSDVYYEEIDRRIRQEFPHKFSNGKEKSARKSPAVASAGRSSSRSSKKSVKLNSSQVAIAKKLGVSLEQYAKQVALLQNS
jgi:hypothetical protein